MPKTVYDTRFFLEHYYSREASMLRKTREAIRKAKERFISAIVIHEVYWLTLKQEGRETAVMRASLLEKDFKVVKVDSEIARSSAELRHKYRMSMAQSIIVATALLLKATCLSDDPHFKSISEIKTSWI
jgi:predicted nucleic acid-binding protein